MLSVFGSSGALPAALPVSAQLASGVRRPPAIDNVVLTGDRSLVGALVATRFGAKLIASENKLASIAHGLAPTAWEDPSE